MSILQERTACISVPEFGSCYHLPTQREKALLQYDQFVSLRPSMTLELIKEKRHKKTWIVRHYQFLAKHFPNASFWNTEILPGRTFHVQRDACSIKTKICILFQVIFLKINLQLRFSSSKMRSNNTRTLLITN